jgi:predicted ATPase
MFRKIALENFKAFGERQEMPLAPITLIYGPNSAGKSSIIQSLLWMKQTCDPELNESNRLIFRGNLVDLGSFNSIVHRHESKLPIGIEMTVSKTSVSKSSGKWSSATNFLLGLVLKKLRGSEDREGSELSEVVLGRSASGGMEPGFQNLSPTRFKRLLRPVKLAENEAEYKHFEPENESALRQLQEFADGWIWRALRQRDFDEHTGETENLNDFFDDLFPDVPFSAKRFRLEMRGKEMSGSEFIFRMWQSPRRFLPVLSSRVNSESHSQSATNAAATLVTRALQQSIQNVIAELAWITYLGPLRKPPERHYVLSGSGRGSVGKSGEFTAEVLHSSSRRLREELNRWLVALEIPYEIQLKSYGDDVSGDLVLMVLKERRSKVLVSPADVGFGVGQLLPILVEGIAYPGSIICVEQPEIHLHPRLQGHLADFFVETCMQGQVDHSERSRRSRRVGGVARREQRNQWIVETHSEALMLRLRRRIREGTLDPNMVSVLYVAPGVSGGSVVKPIKLNHDGDFEDEWPGGFFEERFDDLL